MGLQLYLIGLWLVSGLESEFMARCFFGAA
jgi:hypothetical protein